MIQVRLESNYAFLDCVLYLFLYCLDIMTFFLQSDPQRREQPLGTGISTIGEEVLLGRFVVFRLFIESEIGEMHEHVFHILRRWLSIVLRAESGQSLVAQVRFNGVEASDENIETQIEFLLVQQNRRFDVSLDQQVRVMIGPQILGYAFELVNQENALTTFSRIGFANEGEFGMLFHVGLKGACFFRQQEADWCKSKLLVEGLSHPIGDGAEHLLPRHVLHKWVPVPVELVFADLFEVLVIQS